MGRRRLALLTLLLLGVSGAMVGCGPSPEQRRQAEERIRLQRQAQAMLERCRRDQPAVQRLSAEIQQRSTELANLEAERYWPAGRPQPPDPALAARFTQEDRDLDELRYRERLRSWEEVEQRRYGRWLDEQRSRRELLRSQLQQAANQLRRIAPTLLVAPDGSTLRADAVARASRCAPADFGVQDKAVPGKSSKAVAN